MWFPALHPEGLMGVKALPGRPDLVPPARHCHSAFRHPLYAMTPELNAGLHRAHIVNHRPGDLHRRGYIIRRVD